MTRVRVVINAIGVQLKWTGACMCTEFARSFKTVNVFMEVQWKLGKMGGFFSEQFVQHLSICYVIMDVLQKHWQDLSRI